MVFLRCLMSEQVPETGSGQEFPSFRMFDLSELSDVEIDQSEGGFEISDDYNPEWSGYEFVIAKV